jgi:hypothetical protein
MQDAPLAAPKIDGARCDYEAVMEECAAFHLNVLGILDDEYSCSAIHF